ncbi:hypothetical protein ACWGSA_00880 [Streptomyces diastaticus]
MSDANPFMAMSPAEIDVIDDMLQEWNERDRHGELNGGYGYGPRKGRALDTLTEQVREAWRAKVRYADPEETE